MLKGIHYGKWAYYCDHDSVLVSAAQPQRPTFNLMIHESYSIYTIAFVVLNLSEKTWSDKQYPVTVESLENLPTI